MADPTRRLVPLRPEEFDARTRGAVGETREPVARLEGRDPEASRPPNILSTIAHHPPLLEPFLGFATALAARGVLERRDSELLALRAAWNCRSAFEWGHHVLYALAAGLTEAQVSDVARGSEAPAWSEADRLLLETADALHFEQQVDQEMWERLAARFDAAQLVEIPFVVGHYTMLSMVANATGVPLEEGLPPMPPRR
jgi:alkylhydroperoxidase family enzyme